MTRKPGQHDPDRYLSPSDDPLLGLHFAECDHDLEKIKWDRRKGGYRVRCGSCKATKFVNDERAKSGR